MSFPDSSLEEPGNEMNIYTPNRQ